MIAKAAQFHAVDAFHGLHFRDGITHPPQPFEKDILAICGEVVANLE